MGELNGLIVFFGLWIVAIGVVELAWWALNLNDY